MNPKIEESVLLAYTLGELSDEDAAAVDAELARSDEARAVVDGFRRFSERVAKEAPASAQPGLSPAQLEAITAKLSSAKVGPPSRGRSPVLIGPLVGVVTAVAASLALMFFGSPEREATFEVEAPELANLRSGDFVSKNAVRETLEALGVSTPEDVDDVWLRFDATGSGGRVHGRYRARPGEDPVAFVAKHAEVFVRSNTTRSTAVLRGQIDFLRTQLGLRETEVKEAELRVREFRGKHDDELSAAKDDSATDPIFESDAASGELEAASRRIVDARRLRTAPHDVASRRIMSQKERSSMEEQVAANRKVINRRSELQVRYSDLVRDLQTNQQLRLRIYERLNRAELQLELEEQALSAIVVTATHVEPSASKPLARRAPWVLTIGATAGLMAAAFVAMRRERHR